LQVSFTYAGNATAPTNAGSYAVLASIADPNYAGSASGTLVIAKAAPSVVVTPYSLTYDGQSHTAQGSATGVLGESLGGLDLSGTTHTSAGSYTDAWAFTDVSGNYNNAAGTVSDVITKASAMIAVTPYHVIYDGSAHTATGSALGVSGEALAGLNLGATTHTNAGSYSDGWSFTDLTGNYANASGTVTDSIAKAVASITLAPLAQRYDGTPKRVTATTTPSGLAVNLTYDGGTTAPIYPGPHTVVAIVDDANYVGTQTDTLTISVTALVRHAPTLDGVIDGSIETLLPENAALNATASISGDLLVPGSPIVNVHRQATYAGTLDATGSAAPANYTVALNAGAVLRHVVRRVDAIALPTVATPPAPTGTRDVTLDGTAGGVALAPGTYGALAVGGNATLVLGVVGGTEPVVYNFQSLTLSGTAAIEIAGPVEITIARGAALGGRVGLGAHPEWLVLRVANDGASASADTTLNGNAVFYGSLIVPGGTVTLAGNAAVHGNIIADRLTLSGGLLADPVP
jgi:rhamnogalacturonan endolyase